MGSQDTDDRVLAIVKSFLKKHGYPPTVREIGAMSKLTHTGAHDSLCRLRKAGILDWAPGKTRTLRLC